MEGVVSSPSLAILWIVLVTVTAAPPRTDYRRTMSWASLMTPIPAVSTVQKTDTDLVIFPHIASSFNVSLTKGCKCVKADYSCGCCVQVKIEEINFNKSACVNVQYRDMADDIALSVIIQRTTVLKKTLSAKNPSPVCFERPLIDPLGMCVTLYYLDMEHGFAGCIGLEMRNLLIKEDFDLGCFQIEASEKSEVQGENEQSTSLVNQQEGSTNLLTDTNVAISPLVTSSLNTSLTKGCKCVKAKHSCGCCVQVKMKEIHFDKSACVDVQYLKEEVGIALSIVIEDTTVFSDTLSAKNPPPVCFDVPLIPKLHMCATFYDLDIKHGFSGCVKLKAQFLVLKKYIDVGCFQIEASEKPVARNEDRQKMQLVYKQEHVVSGTDLWKQKKWKNFLDKL